MENTQTQTQQMVIPVSVVSPTDIARLRREIENIDEFFRQSEIRVGGTPNALPRYSRLLDELVVSNKLNLLQPDHRAWLIDSIRGVQDTSPVLHISFSVDPPGPYVQKIVAWVRERIDPCALVRVGLQPNIGAGCVVRTTNKSFDFSLRQFFMSKRDFFTQKLHEVITQPDALAAVVGSSEAPQVVATATTTATATAPQSQLEASVPAQPVSEAPAPQQAAPAPQPTPEPSGATSQ